MLVPAVPRRGPCRRPLVSLGSFPGPFVLLLPISRRSHTLNASPTVWQHRIADRRTRGYSPSMTCRQRSSQKAAPTMSAPKETANWSRRQLLQYAAAGAGLLPVFAVAAEPAREAEKEAPERIAAKIAANETIQRAVRRLSTFSSRSRKTWSTASPCTARPWSSTVTPSPRPRPSMVRPWPRRSRRAPPISNCKT